MLYVFDGSTTLDAVDRALETYIAKDVHSASLERGMIESAVESICSARNSLEESNRELSNRFPEFQHLVSNAHLNKKRRLEYNDKASDILAVVSKELSQTRLREMSEILDTLRQSNRKLARTIEYRRRQIEPLMYWATVLETGQF